MKRLCLCMVVFALSACDGSGEYLKCVDNANKSTPLAAVPVCAKKHQYRLGRNVFHEGKASWDGMTFTISDLSVEPGYAITMLKVKLNNKKRKKEEVIDVPIFYLVGHLGSMTGRSVRTNTSSPGIHYLWEWNVVEVWGVNTL